MPGLLNALLGAMDGDGVTVLICARNVDLSGSRQFQLRQLASLGAQDKPVMFLWDGDAQMCLQHKSKFNFSVYMLIRYVMLIC